MFRKLVLLFIFLFYIYDWGYAQEVNKSQIPGYGEEQWDEPEYYGVTISALAYYCKVNSKLCEDNGVHYIDGQINPDFFISSKTEAKRNFFKEVVIYYIHNEYAGLDRMQKNSDIASAIAASIFHTNNQRAMIKLSQQSYNEVMGEESLKSKLVEDGEFKLEYLDAFDGLNKVLAKKMHHKFILKLMDYYIAVDERRLTEDKKSYLDDCLYRINKTLKGSGYYDEDDLSYINIELALKVRRYQNSPKYKELMAKNNKAKK